MYFVTINISFFNNKLGIIPNVNSNFYDFVTKQLWNYWFLTYELVPSFTEKFSVLNPMKTNRIATVNFFNFYLFSKLSYETDLVSTK